MGQQMPTEKKFRLVAVLSSGNREVVARDLDHDRAIELQQSLSKRFRTVTIEEQTPGESPLVQ